MGVRRLSKLFVASALLVVGCISGVFAATILTPGDIVITTVNADSSYSATGCPADYATSTNNLFSFVNRVDVTSGTVIYFTDNAWSGTIWRSGEGTLVFTATNLIPAGTNTYYNDCALSAVPANWSRTGGFDPANGGDNILVYQGVGVDDPNPSFIYGVGWSIATPWISSGSPSTNNSYIPAALTSGTTAIFPTTLKNAQYICSTNLHIGSPSFLTNVGSPTNWTGSSVVGFFASTCSFVSSYTLNYLTSTGGTLTGNTTQTGITYGSTGTAVQAIASTGYTFSGWSDGYTGATRIDGSITTGLTVTGIFHDITPPVIVLLGASDIILPNMSVYSDLGATATDSLDGDRTSFIVVSGTVDTSMDGRYLITYYVSDVSGNTSSITRTVTVFTSYGGSSSSSTSSTSTSPVVPDSNTSSGKDVVGVIDTDESDIDIFNPSITDGYCYTSKTDFSIVDSSTITTNLEFERSLTFMYAYELTKFNSVDKFGPYTNLTREQAAKIFSNFALKVLCRKPDLSLKVDYVDVGDADPSLAPYITTAYQLGLMKGGNGLFRPFDTISKAEFNAVLMRMILKSYLDESSPTWYTTYNSVATDLGVITQGAGLQPVLRHDAALMLFRAYKEQEFSLQNIDHDSFVIVDRSRFID